MKRKNNTNIDYKLPKRKKNLMTKEFLQSFKDELDNIFDKENDYPSLDKRNYWNTYQYMESTTGFYQALKIVCQKYNLTKAIYNYACNMSLDDSDIFDGELTLLMVERGVIEKGDINETKGGLDDSFYENNSDFQLETTIKRYKDYSAIKKEWVLTKEYKERMGINDES